MCSLQAGLIIEDGRSVTARNISNIDKASSQEPSFGACLQVPGIAWRSSNTGSNATFEIPAVELADGLEHRGAPGKGRALFATRAFKREDVVLANRPVAVDSPLSTDKSAALFSHSDGVITTSSQVLTCGCFRSLPYACSVCTLRGS